MFRLAVLAPVAATIGAVEGRRGAEAPKGAQVSPGGPLLFGLTSHAPGDPNAKSRRGYSPQRYKDLPREYSDARNFSIYGETPLIACGGRATKVRKVPTTGSHGTRPPRPRCCAAALCAAPLFSEHWSASATLSMKNADRTAFSRLARPNPSFGARGLGLLQLGVKIPYYPIVGGNTCTDGPSRYKTMTCKFFWLIRSKLPLRVGTSR